MTERTEPSHGLDLYALARHARAAVREGRDATLFIAGVGMRVRVDSGTLRFGDTGDPGFVCADASPLAQAGGCSARLQVTGPYLGRIRTTVVLTGRLGEPQSAEPGGTVTLSFTLTSVTVELDDPELSTIAQRMVPLELYRGAAPEPPELPELLSTYAAALTEHTVTNHQEQLRWMVSVRTGVAPSQVAGVSICGLDRDGLFLNWVDTDGAHCAYLSFPYPAADPPTLSVLLRQQLHSDAPLPR